MHQPGGFNPRMPGDHVWNEIVGFNWAAVAWRSWNSVSTQRTHFSSEDKINKGETGVMRLLCDGEDMQPVLGRATMQQNCWATCVLLDLPLSLPLSLFILLINCHTGLSNRIRDKQATAHRGLQRHGGVAPKVELQGSQTAAHFTAQTCLTFVNCNFYFV